MWNKRANYVAISYLKKNTALNCSSMLLLHVGGKGCDMAQQTPVHWGYAKENIQGGKVACRGSSWIKELDPGLCLEELSLKKLGMKQLGFVSLCCLPSPGVA